MYPVATIADALGIKLAASTQMTLAIQKWMYLFTQNSGLCLPAAIAAELARLATIESEILITGSARAQYLTECFGAVKNDLRCCTEFGVAGGGLVFKPYVGINGKIAVSYVKANACYPVAFDFSGRLSAVVFAEKLLRGSTSYTRLEFHHMERGGCVIENKAFATAALNSSTMLGEPVALASVPEWAQLEPCIKIENADRLLLGYFKMPLANTTDDLSPLGISCYARAVELIRQADEQWERILWEYQGSELAIHADEAMFCKENGVPDLPKGKESLYRLVSGDIENSGKLFAFSPQIRDASLFNGLNHILKRIEFTCGLAYGTLSDPQNTDITAEEIKASKQRSYALVRDIQKALEAALGDLIYSMDIWASLCNEPCGEYKASFEWDNSIIANPAERKLLYWQYVKAGKYPFWRYLVKFENFTEEEARAAAEAESLEADSKSLSKCEANGAHNAQIKSFGNAEAPA